MGKKREQGTEAKGEGEGEGKDEGEGGKATEEAPAAPAMIQQDPGKAATGGSPPPPFYNNGGRPPLFYNNGGSPPPFYNNGGGPPHGDECEGVCHGCYELCGEDCPCAKDDEEGCKKWADENGCDKCFECHKKREQGTEAKGEGEGEGKDEAH